MCGALHDKRDTQAYDRPLKLEHAGLRFGSPTMEARRVSHGGWLQHIGACDVDFAVPHIHDASGTRHRQADDMGYLACHFVVFRISRLRHSIGARGSIDVGRRTQRSASDGAGKRSGVGRSYRQQHRRKIRALGAILSRERTMTPVEIEKLWLGVASTAVMLGTAGIVGRYVLGPLFAKYPQRATTLSKIMNRVYWAGLLGSSVAGYALCKALGSASSIYPAFDPALLSIVVVQYEISRRRRGQLILSLPDYEPADGTLFPFKSTANTVRLWLLAGICVALLVSFCVVIGLDHYGVHLLATTRSELSVCGLVVLSLLVCSCWFVSLLFRLASSRIVVSESGLSTYEWLSGGQAPFEEIHASWDRVWISNIRLEGFYLTVDGYFKYISRTHPRLNQLYGMCLERCPHTPIRERGRRLRQALFAESRRALASRWKRYPAKTTLLGARTAMTESDDCN
jgi:hypothetical protein